MSHDATAWRPVLGVVLASLAIRCLQLLALTVASNEQAATGRATVDGSPSRYFVYQPSPARPGLGGVLGNWDGQWYMRIADAGYPPVDHVLSANDAWVSAFPPGFPMLARATMAATGMPFVWASLVINTVVTLFAVVMLFQLLQSSGIATRASAAASVGVSLLPASPVLVIAYSEALALALLIFALRLLIARRYFVLALAVVALALTRPIAVALAPVVALHAASRWQTEGGTVTWRAWAGMGVAAVTAGISPWIWPRTAAQLYGVPEGGPISGSARADQIASGLGSGFLGKTWSVGGAGALVLLLLGLLILVGLPTLLGLRMHWPVELLAWGSAYVALVVIATTIHPGFIRYVVLAAPLLVVVFAAPLAHPGPAKIVLLTALVAACLWSQWFWIRYLFILDPAPNLLPWAP